MAAVCNGRQTKIVATLGPATDTEARMTALLEAGVNVVRLNFSHGAHEEHQRRMDLVRACSQKLGVITGILADLQGPKIRVASFAEGPIELKEGATFCLDAALDEHAGTETVVGIDYKTLPSDVASGDQLLLDDGRIQMDVLNVEGEKIHCKVVIGGKLSDHKGINRLGGGLSAKALTDKDRDDMRFALSQHVDFIAISFPRSAEDMQEARACMQGFGGDAALIAKIERFEAVGNLDAIIEASDAVMVARGDLAVEIGEAKVPLVQKRIIQRARALNKPVITATQMMESMIENTAPTRAEVSDVANAVIDVTDAVMLSAETAVGRHPALVVEAMARACEGAEESPDVQRSGHRVECYFERIDEALAMSCMYVANHLKVRALLALTESGHTPLLMSRIRTGIPIYALSRHQKTLGLMSLFRGVIPLSFDLMLHERKHLNQRAIEVVEKAGSVDSGDLVILTKGDQLGVGGYTNAMKVLVVGEVH
jgi:pyruvate kinase